MIRRILIVVDEAVAKAVALSWIDEYVRDGYFLRLAMAIDGNMSSLNSVSCSDCNCHDVKHMTLLTFQSFQIKIKVNFCYHCNSNLRHYICTVGYYENSR